MSRGIDGTGGALRVGPGLPRPLQLEGAGQLAGVDLVQDRVVPVEVSDGGDEVLLYLQVARQVLGEGR
jgi:hypothetical protein